MNRACVVCSQTFEPGQDTTWWCGPACFDRLQEINASEQEANRQIAEHLRGTAEPVLDFGDDDEPVSQAEQARRALGTSPGPDIKRFTDQRVDVERELDQSIALLAALRSVEYFDLGTVRQVVALVRGSLDRVTVALGADSEHGNVRQVDHPHPRP